MNSMDGFVKAIIAAELPRQEAILTALGELYTTELKGEIDDMAASYELSGNLSRVFVDGFDWQDTPQGHEWWAHNVRGELTRRGL